ncbi:MAG: hypothetical protein JWP89_3174 [Schlesneria sp.]|nr:hypothetical protein [Schlesneria sp.]
MIARRAMDLICVSQLTGQQELPSRSENLTPTNLDFGKATDFETRRHRGHGEKLTRRSSEPRKTLNHEVKKAILRELCASVFQVFFWLLES